MKILVYSEVTAANIAVSLGKPEYSYYFVLKEFTPALKRFGEVIVINCPETEVDPIFKQCRLQNERCVFLSFSPPHRTTLSLRCPTIPVFAWEFESIPTEIWNARPENDWRYVLDECGKAIVHSAMTMKSVQEAMGNEFPVESIPAPVWDKFAQIRQQLSNESQINPKKHTINTQRGVVIDTNSVSLEPYKPTPATIPNFVASNEPKIKSPNSFKPEETVQISSGFLSVSRLYLVSWYRLVLRDSISKQTRKLLANIVRRALNFLKKNNTTPAVTPNNTQITEENCTIAQPAVDSLSQTLLQPKSHTLTLSGVVFTSVFNPYDGRKNWTDMLTAFCEAFRDVSDATLLFKLTHQEYASAVEGMLTCLGRLPPFKCRIVIFHGYLDDSDFRALISATSFVVNASHGEGQCLPLMEFLSCGIPAIAPRNSAMEEYISPQIAFVVNSWLDATAWPHDPRLAYRTLRHQLDWESLVQCYKNAYHCSKETPDVYKKMSSAAVEKMRHHCSLDSATKKLASILDAPIKSNIEAQHV